MTKLDHVIFNYAQDVIKVMAAERRLDIEDIKTLNHTEYVKARSAIIKRLSADGLTAVQIGNALGLLPKTVSRRLSQTALLRENAANTVRYHARQQA